MNLRIYSGPRSNEAKNDVDAFAPHAKRRVIEAFHREIASDRSNNFIQKRDSGAVAVQHGEFVNLL